METPLEPKATIRDVAKRANVALGTVSRVINGHPNVRDETRKRVRKAIEELGYAPNIVAQSMRNRRSMAFACVMRDFTVPVLSLFVDSMQKEIDPFGFSLMVASNYHDSRREIALLRSFQQRRIDGLVIATSSENDPDLTALLREVDFPIVLIDRDRPAQLDAVCVNHAPATRQAVDYLVDLGHRRIAIISGEAGLHPARSRLSGYTAALRGGGLPVDSSLVRMASFGADAGYAEALSLLRSAERPTAILAGGTALLPGVIRAVREVGLRVPQDISIIAGADSDVAQLASSPITVVRWSHDQLGKAAGRFLMERLANPLLARQRLAVKAEFIIRESCASPPSTLVGAAAKAKPVGEAKPVGKVKSAAKIKPAAQAESMAKLKSAAQAEPMTKLKSAAKAEPMTKIKSAAKAEPMTKIKSAAKLDVASGR